MSITVHHTNEIDSSYYDLDTEQVINDTKYQVYFDWDDGVNKTQNGYFVAMFDTNVDLATQCQNWIDANSALDTAVLVPV